MAVYTKAAEAPSEPLTIAYKVVDGLPIHIDVYPPAVPTTSAVPAVIYYHGGALTVGNRGSWFPAWLHHRVTSSGMVFISADYRLLPPATGHDVLADIKDLFSYLETQVNHDIQQHLQHGPPRPFSAFEIDPSSLAVAGSSAGGICAYLAAIHASPQPKAVLSLYGMGGDCLTWQYLAVKTTPFFRGREILDPADFPEYLHPACHALPPTSDSPLAYHPQTYRIPGYPANPRMLLGRLYLQHGTFLDYYTGAHAPSLSAALRAQLPLDAPSPPSSSSTAAAAPSLPQNTEHRDKIPAEHRALFPQFCVAPGLPPMFLMHGTADTAVLLVESQNFHRLLQDAGVACTLEIVDGKEHSFDYEPSAEAEFGAPGGLFDRAMGFLQERLRGCVRAK